MKITLYHRHYGVHTPIKSLEVSCNFEDVYKGDDKIDEELLLANISDGWLPVPASHVLLYVRDGNFCTGQSTCGIFRTWGKYFDSYLLELAKLPIDRGADGGIICGIHTG